MAQHPCQLRRGRCQRIPPDGAALPRCKHGTGKRRRAEQLSRPSQHPQGCGYWSLFPATERPFLLQVTRQCCSHKSWPPALKGQHKCCSLGLANKAITTGEKSQLIPECWRWALRCHIAPGRSSEAAGQRGAHSHMEPTSGLLGIVAVIFPGRKPGSQAWLVYLQPPERQGSTSPSAGKGKKLVQEEKQHHRGCSWDWRGGCEPPLPHGPAAVGRRV